MTLGIKYTAVFVQEVPEENPLANQLYLRASSPDGHPDSAAVINQDWHDSHWGTRLLELRDPDGRTVMLEHGDANED